jgi:hypothetical protein
VVFLYNRTAIYSYGGSCKDDSALRKRPNEAVFWHAIREMKRAGMEVFDFGSTPVAHANLLRFKKKWNTKTEDLFYLYWKDGHRTGGFNREGSAARFVSRSLTVLPERLFEMVGKRLIRQVG